jgi:hypothetical protein
MLPDIEVFGILKNGKRHATVTLIYSDKGWVAHVVRFDQSNGSKVIAKGTNTLSKDSAKVLVSELGNKWRDGEEEAGRI